MSHCPNITSPAWRNLVDAIGETEAWREFFKYGYIPDSSNYVLKSIRARSTEDIAAGINPELIRSKDELKYTDHIVSLVINEFGEITPNQVARVNMDKAFENTKAKFEKAFRGMNDFINIVQSQENFDKLMSEKPEVMQSLIQTYSLQGIDSFDDVTKVKDRYQTIIEKFDRYKDYAKADLLHRGIKEVKGKVQLVSIEDVTDQEQNDTEDTLLAQQEIGERYDKAANEINPLLTASLRVRALVQAVPIPGAYELGIPLYADPSDVFSDLLDAGVNMQLTGYTTTKGKYDVFMDTLQEMAQGRPYLYTVINKLEAFRKNNEWDTINQMLTFVTKAFANETLVLYKTRRSGSTVMGVSEVKVINLNRDTVEQQVSRDWYNSLLQSKFFIKDATGQRFPKPEKVEELARIIEQGRGLSGPEQVKKFQEFFKVFGISLTDADMEYIAPKMGGAIKKNKSFEIVFAKNGMLENIHADYAKNLNNPFEGDYGLQNEKKNMNKLARLYYEANPGRYKLPSSKTADGKQKHLHVQPSFAELRKRDWTLGNTAKVTNSALARPNKQFWVDVRNSEKTFELNYFNGMREQEAGKDGKVRKNFTPSEQVRAMFMKHQENMNTGTYVIFTLSDKTTSIEAKMTKEFFVDGKVPVGKNQDFILKNGEVEYTPAFREKMYDSFVAPEISRILSAIAAGEKVNLENYDIASKLFYIIPIINSSPFLENFRKDLYSGAKTEQELKALYGELIGSIVTAEFVKSTEEQIDDYIKRGIIKNINGIYTYPSFKNGFAPTDYVNRFRATEAQGRNLARLMVMDMKTNYMNAQVKTIQFLRFDPALAFKAFKGFNKVPFSQITGKDRVKLAKSTWDEFSKRAAALIAPGSQGNWGWETSIEKGGKYFSSEYKAITAADRKVTVGKTENETTDAQEFVTMQEHIDYLMSEGKIPLKIWESITKKIKEAGPGGYYELSGEELKYTFTPVKPVHVNDVDESDKEYGLSRVDYVKSSRYPLIPEHEAGSERDKLRQWMEKNDIRSLNFASGKKLGRPGESVTLFDKDGNFVEPDKASVDAATQILSRDGLRNQQEIPHQKEEIATVSQMNRTILDGLLDETFTFGELGDLKGRELKDIKERIRSRLFEIKAAELENEMGNLAMSHVGIHNLLKKVILEDTTGTYGENDLRLIELDEKGMFKYPLEMNFKFQKIQGLINSMINRNVMLKMNGTSFVQVSGVGSKFTFSSLSDKVKSGIIWTSDYAKQFKEGDVASLSYIRKEGNDVKPAQVIVSQYIKDEDGNLIDLSEFITEKNGMKILDTSKINKSLLQLVASRIPNQSLTSTLPIEVVGFLPSYMENTIVVPDGITGQMGSDFDVDKLYVYTSTPKEVYENKKLVKLDAVGYKLSSLSDIDNMSEEELKQAYKDLHWTVLTSPAAFGSITKSVDMPEVKTKVKMREDMLNRYEIGMDDAANLPLDFNTSITRFSDNKSGKDGVSIFANLISAQADFQNKILRLGYKDEKGVERTEPVKIKLTKNGKVIDLLYMGRLGESTSFVNKNVKRSISDNLNIMFTEAVDNAKNQFLREFNWTEKSMSAVGALQMLTSEDGQTPPIEFSMDLTSQRAIIKLFDLIDQKQDSFNEFDSNAFQKSVNEIQEELIKRIDTGNYLKNGQKAVEYLLSDERDNVLDPQTLSQMWLIGNILQDGSAVMNAKAYEQTKTDLTGKEEDVLVYDPITHSYITPSAESKEVFENSVVEPKLIKAMKEFGYKSLDDMLLAYYTTQYDSVELFSRLNTIGREMMTILGSVYTYTKGIGPDVFTAKQKLNQLNVLSNSGVFLGIENIAGEVFKSDTGRISIIPQGEIGTSIEKSLIVAQDIYSQLFPISSGMFVEEIAQSIMDDKGWTKDSLGKQTFLNLYEDVFDAVKAYLFTNQNLELFANARAIRASLINGETSLGATVTKLKEIPEFSRNGFLKNLEVKHEYNSEVYTISFKAPLGAEMDEKSILSGFYELATSDNEVVRETARNLALYPFATGDAGLLGRFIPVDYYMEDEDFKKAISDLESVFSFDMSTGGTSIIKDQIVQNNPETYAKKFNFTTTDKDNVFKRNFRKIKSVGNVNSLEKLKSFTISLGDFEADPAAQGIIESLQVDLSNSERLLASSIGVSTNKKYPPYIMITDTVISDNPAADRSNKYLYKRTSPAVTGDGIATYERINILGFKNIKEFSFSEESLKSAIANNQVDVSDQEFKEVGTDQATPDDAKPKTTEVVVPGVLNIPDSGLTIEKANEFIDLLQPQIVSQAYIENKAKTANMMFSFGLRWAKNIPNSTEKSEQGSNLGQPRPDRKDIKSKEGMTYGYYLTDQNNNPLPSMDQLQPIMDFIQSRLGIDMSDYDAMLGNIYDEKSFIHQHRDTTESVTAEGYPVIVLNLGADGNLEYDKDVKSTYASYKKSGQLNLTNGGIYAFGVDGENRFTFHHRIGSGLESANPLKPIVLPNGQTLTNYRITLTFRRASDLEVGMPEKPAKIATQPIDEVASKNVVASIPQNKVSGVESYGSLVTAAPNVIEALGSNPHSIDMIEAGFRTRTTRSADEMTKYAIKVGDTIKHFGKSADGTTKEILARVTAIHPKGSPGWKGTWFKEGWDSNDINVIDRFKDGAAAIEFEVVKPTQQPVISRSREYTPEKLTKENMPANGIFVFGSNTEGRHGLGAAKTAVDEFGAKYGQAQGLQGQSYAIVTKDLAKGKRSVDLDYIRDQIFNLVDRARYGDLKDKKIYVTKLGTNLAGFTVDEIKELFRQVDYQENISDNVVLPKEYEVRDEVVDNKSSTTSKTGNNPADYTNHSGGAKLADAEWDQIGREYGVTDHRHYREPLEYTDTKGEVQKGSETLDSQRLRDKGIKPTHITQQEYNEGARKATAAFRMMYKDSENKSVRQAYIIRNWLQVKNADAVFALGTIKQPGENASDKAGETRVAAIPIIKGGTGYAVQMAINEGKPVYVFDGTKEGWYKYDYSVKNFVKTDTPTLTKNFAGIGSRTLGSQEVIDKSLQAIRDVYENTFKNNQTSQTEEDESPTTNIVGYGAHTFILEGSEEEGFTMWYQKEGGKGKPVTDPGVINKVTLKHLVELHPENVVTLTDLPRSPKYYVSSSGEILSLQDSTYGDKMTGEDITTRVNAALAQKLEHDVEVEDFTKDILEKEKDAKTGKKINVPEGSSPSNMKIFEDENTIYLMNDGQQKAYNFIRSQVTKLLESSPYITESNLTQTLNNTAAFLNPLNQKFNGIIPKAMWDNMIGLAGRGGVGKTTVIKAIMDSIEGANKYSAPNVMYLTPSHTAATVLQESLGRDSEKANDGVVNTIQSHVRRNVIVPGKDDLELASEEDYVNSWKFKPKVTSPDIIIVDESSMIKSDDIKDILTRLQTDVLQGGAAKMPIFIFMGDYRQLGPVSKTEQQNSMVNKGIISSTLFMDPEKTVELTQVMRSGDKELHEVFDSVGSQIIENMKLTQQGQQPKTLSFEPYDKLTSRSTPNMLVVNNEMGVIDDYTTFLMENNNPYGMFWVHYNNVANPKTKNLAAKIRSMYFQKAGYVVDDEGLKHRKFSKGDYIEFTNGLEMGTSSLYYTPTSDAIKKLLDGRKTPIRNGEYFIQSGMIKPRTRLKVLDIVKSQESVKDIIPSEISKFIDGDPTIEVEKFLLYNRQNKIRIIQKALGLQVQLGTYNKASRQQEGITIKNKFTGEVYAKFNMFYGEFKGVKDKLAQLNDETAMPFVPSYIGSSHTAQGNSIKNVIVGEYNVKENRANPEINQDDIFSSLYVSLTRTSGKLIIIKPMGVPIANNQEVFEGAITDNNHNQKLVSSVQKASIIPQVPLASDSQIVSNNGNEKLDPLALLNQSEQKVVIDGMMRNLFQDQKIITDYRGFMNRLIKDKTLTPFNKSFLDALSKMKVLTPFTIVTDENQKDPGTYDIATKTIRINLKEALDSSMDVVESANAIHEVIMHELIHHLTADMLQANPDTLTEEQRKWVDNITDLFIKVQQQMLNDPNHKEGLLRTIQQVNSDNLMSIADKGMYYGLSNVFDFVSMLMTDKNFQEFMNNTKVEGEKSIFTKFIDFLTDFLFKQLGIKVKDESVLKEGVKNIVGLIKSRDVVDETTGGVLKSAKAVRANVENVEKNFNDIIKFLSIKTKC